MENGLSASDVALMNRDTGFGGEAFMWIFALLILAGGGFGGGFGYGNNAVAQDAMQNGFNFNDLQDQNRDLMGAITNGTAQSVATTNQTFHDSLFALNDKYSELARDISGVGLQLQQILANQNECCSTTKMEIAKGNYDAAMQMAQMEARLVAKMDSNEIQTLRDKVSALELNNAVAGVVKYPNSWVFDAGKAPFCTCTTTASGTTGA